MALAKTLEAPLVTSRVILEHKPFYSSDPACRMLVFGDRLVLDKPQERAIRLLDVRGLCFEGGKLRLDLDDETLVLGAASAIATAAIDGEETRILASVLGGLRTAEADAVRAALEEMHALQRRRRIHMAAVAAIIVLGAMAATLLAQLDPSLHWLFLAFVVLTAVLVPQPSRSGPTFRGFEQGVKELKKGNAAAAVAALAPLRTANPNWIELLANLGIAHMQCEHYEDADACLTRVMALRPDHPQREVFEKWIRKAALLGGPPR